MTLLDNDREAVLSRELARHGLSRNLLRGQRWQQFSRGLHLRNPVTLADPEKLSWLLRVLPADAVFGHLTSAALRGWWLPNRLPAHVIFATTAARVHVQRRGVYVRRTQTLWPDKVCAVPVASADQTLVELARDLSLVDLVPMVDCALAGGARQATVLALSRRQRGVVRLRQALALADPRSESWWESVLRLMHVCAEVGPVESQVEVFDDGVFVGRADLHLVGTNRFPEYDGADHRDRDRHHADLRREKALDRVGARRYGYVQEEIERHPAMIIRDAEAARGWSHDPRRVDAWLQVVRDSSLTPHGRARLAGRLERYRAAALR